MNILGSDGNAHKTLGEEPLVCSSTSPTIQTNDLQMGFFDSKDELNLQSSTSRLPVSLAMPLTTDCSTMQSRIGFEDVKPNPVSKCLPDGYSSLGVLFSQWLYSDQKETPTITMASERLEISEVYPQSAIDSEDSSCISYQSESLAMSELEYPLSKEMENIKSTEFSPGLHRQSATLSPFDSSLPCHETILCNELSTTLQNTSMNIDEYWDIMSYNEVDLGMHCDSSLIENCSLLDFTFS